MPLTKAERDIRAKDEFDKALTHLVEAERMSAWGRAPNACVHSAYYAMHHAAVAALLAAGGVGARKDVPRSHEHIIEHYGKLIANEIEPLAGTGRALNAARTDRVVADYDLVHGATDDDARETTSTARVMLDAIRRKWGFVVDSMVDPDE